MRFSMMAVNGNRMFDVCKNLIVVDLECIEKLNGMGCSDDCIQEALHIFFNHVCNLYVCGMIEEEFFRYVLDDVIEDEDIEDVIAAANDIRKDVVCMEDGQKI